KNGLRYVESIDKYFGAHYFSVSHPVGFNIAVTNNLALVPQVPHERALKKIFEKWSGSPAQKILRRIVNGTP
ncbi:MAG: hypothetical protein Q7S28_03720, partial [bacterium]|nr:hypothetical protein [bacterium]